MPKKREVQKVIKVIAVLFLIAFIGALFIFIDDILCCPHISNKAHDSRIIFGISKVSQDIMIDIYTQYDNFDNFSCHYKSMAVLCQDIDRNYTEEDGKEPIIAHDASTNSQTACIYSPLNKEKGWFEKKHFWYCADSQGHIGFTLIDPGTNGYCVDGKSATCPPVSENIP
jgi:hypothetical protein